MPSLTAGGGFVIEAVQVLDQHAGILFYGLNGPNAAPFQGGLLCVRAPARRTPVQTATSGGSPPCVGTLSYDFNARIARHVDPGVTLGRSVCAQSWTRDSGSPSGTGLTDALSFVVGY